MVVYDVTLFDIISISRCAVGWWLFGVLPGGGDLLCNTFLWSGGGVGCPHRAGASVAWVGMFLGLRFSGLPCFVCMATLTAFGKYWSEILTFPGICDIIGVHDISNW